MSAESKLKHQLKELKYRHTDLALRDALPVLNSYRSLVVGKEHFLLPMTSAAKEYVTISGTIPVLYKGTSYNIPICTFLLDTHPYNSPVVFVRPTPDMQIAESRHVDRQGRVYLPYLAEWKHPASDLSGLIQVMCIIFSDAMPVYSKPSGASYQPSPPQYPWHPPPSQHPPPSTTYSNNAQRFYPSQQPPQMYAPPSSQPSSGNLPYPVGPGSSSVQPPQPVGAWPPNPPSMNQTVIGRDTIKASLESAVEDKLKRKFREEFDQLSTELVSLRQTNTELMNGKRQIETILQNCETEKKDVLMRTQAIEEKRKEIEAALNRLRSTKMPPIDEVVTVQYPLYRQLLDAHAEDLAIEDAIYNLGEALGRNKISVEVYLKRVREYSARQFMMRAVVQKCRSVAGLPPITMMCHSH